MSDLVVKELTPSLRDDFLLFFDNVAFADNPDWGDCYCYTYQFSDRGEPRLVAPPQARSRRVGSKGSSPIVTEVLLVGVMQLTATTTLRSTG